MTTEHAGRPVPRPRAPRSRAGHHCALRLIGGFAVSCRGDPLPIPPTARRLVALIALTPGRLDRERAATELWPDAPPDRSTRRLRGTLWQLRDACPALVDDGPDLALTPTVTVDATEVRVLARRLADPLDDDPDLLGTDPRQLAGDLLPGWRDEWLLSEREHLRGRALGALEALAQRLLDAGRPLDALDVVYLAVGADPLRETAVQVLMRGHFALGNRVDALRVYNAFGGRLRQELGAKVRPLNETTRILLDGFEDDEPDDLLDGRASPLVDRRLGE